MKIEILTMNPNIVAVASLLDRQTEQLRVWSTGATNGRLAFFGPLLAKAIETLQVATEPGMEPLPYLRVVFGDMTIVAQREHGQIIAACIPTGHPVAKSLHRMIRRAAKPARALQRAVAGNRRALGLPARDEGNEPPHVCAGCIGGGLCELEVGRQARPGIRHFVDADEVDAADAHDEDREPEEDGE